ncbi:hypothetical protein [Mobiluncus sp.]|uniref:hypothetical protein n=1 Tax=Mobiluncus sp. TaxID=47293 RepID=UPI002A918203|nr:hypothetical protein [Mobiluncus sp.]MDY6076247.1 hypothetical protein [Mobiluncus sp.]
MGNAVEINFVSKTVTKDSLEISESEKEQIIELFEGMCEECFDFTENRCAPWYYHPEEKWPQDIPGLVSSVYVSFADRQKPAFSLLFWMLSHCLSQVKSTQVDAVAIRMGSLNLPEWGSVIEYGKSGVDENIHYSKILQFIGDMVPQPIFPDARGEGYIEAISRGCEFPCDISLRIDYIQGEKMSNFWSILSLLIDRYEKCIIYSRNSSQSDLADFRVIPKNDNPRVLSEHCKLTIGIWEPLVIGRLVRIIFQSLHLAKIHSPICIEIVKC